MSNSRNEAFAATEAEWLEILGDGKSGLVEVWEIDFRRIDAEQWDLERTGRWVSGPADLMAVLGRDGDELSHSDVLAWLLAPARRHGFGDAVMRRVSEILWSGDPLPEGPIVVERERVDPIAKVTRADLIVRVGTTLIVVENKVFAPESEAQCELLYRMWRAEATDARFVLLSRSGAPPVSASSHESRDAWKSISHRQIAEILDELLMDRPPTDELAASTVRQYVATLRRHVA